MFMQDWVHANSSDAFKQELAGGIPVANTLIFNGNVTHPDQQQAIVTNQFREHSFVMIWTQTVAKVAPVSTTKLFATSIQPARS